MRTHYQIIIDAGGYKLLAGKIGVPRERARFWVRRKAIPREHWHAIVESGAASFEELVGEPKAQRLTQPSKAGHGASA